MNLTDLTFPVYYLGTKVPQVDEDGKVYIESNEKILYIDDPNLEYNSLGLRRLALQARGVSLYTVKKGLYYLKDIIKLANGNKTWFIDSAGKYFKYTKTVYVHLVCKKIDKVTPIPSGGSLVECDGLRFKTMYPINDEKYAGLLQLSPKVYILYGVYKDKFNDSRRKV